MNFHTTMRDRASANTSFLKNILFGALTALIVHGALILILGICSLFTKDPGAFLTYLGYGITAISSLVAGFSSAKRNHQGGIVAGLCGGAVFLALLFFISLFLKGNMPFARRTLSYLAALLVSIIGGYMATHKKEKAKDPRRSIKKRKS